MILQKYLYKNLFSHLFCIVCTLIAIFLLIAYLHFVSEAAVAKLNPNDIFKILITEIPVLLQPIMPLGFYLAILVVFRKLFASNEIICMHASGMSEKKIFMPVVVMGLLLIIFATYMQLYVFPLANMKRIYLFEDSIHRITFNKVFPREFNQVSENNVVYVDKKLEKEHKVKGIFFSMLTPNHENELSYDVIVARSLEEIKMQDKSRYVVFINGTRYTAKMSNLESLVVKFQRLGLRITSPDYRLEDWPGCMRVKELFSLSKNNRYAAAEFHWRLSMPISILNLTFFAIAFNLGRIRGYQRTFTILYPLLVYLVYVNLLLASVGLIKNEYLNIHLGLWWVHAAMFAFCLFTLKYKPK